MPANQQEYSHMSNEVTALSDIEDAFKTPELTGYEFLAEKEAELGAAEVARVERLGAYRTLLQIRVDDDPHEATLFRRDFEEVWAVAAGTAEMMPRESTKTAGGQS
jgi:hypothetical protein